MDGRRANERIARKAEHLHFVSRVPMMCECDAPDCRTIVMIGLDDYREIRRNSDQFLTAVGHELEGAEMRQETPTYAVQRLIRPGDAGSGDRRFA
jgi:hypothetical protein